MAKKISHNQWEIIPQTLMGLQVQTLKGVTLKEIILNGVALKEVALTEKM